MLNTWACITKEGGENGDVMCATHVCVPTWPLLIGRSMVGMITRRDLVKAARKAEHAKMGSKPEALFKMPSQRDVLRRAGYSSYQDIFYGLP